MLSYEVTKPKKETGADDEGLKGLMQMLDGNDDEEEEHKHEEGKEQLNEEQKSELREAEKKRDQE
jgi:phage I-like protein